MSGSDQHMRLAGVAGDAISSLGLLTEEVAVTPAGQRRLVRISVDRDLVTIPADDGVSIVPPLSLDEVAEATRAISDALDVLDPFGDTPYVLEVSSPGLSRPLTQFRHFRRNVGRMLEVVTSADGTFTGRLIAAGPDLLTFDVGSGQRDMLPAQITRARVQVEFTHAEDPAAEPTDTEEDVDDVKPQAAHRPQSDEAVTPSPHDDEEI
ncbi:Ribosome maturation factor RimP [Austwickia sp. TVS 96-490-7B]|uniref:ribosome maturation factor RimP n=1 Tax=Austwickia sp. TVS 96-490-7B TaxID=2830843 RepID=UPI001C599E4A|nr:ribosome maturation factor RimP [Austwickia sp. TVS 96-490-7B]MBW3084454.1 Ribosome maturation factor RimP [Austwickia sp. TVS 96-490-7B]